MSRAPCPSTLYREVDYPCVDEIWNRTHVARTPKVCACCKEAIMPGDKYESTGRRIDGEFHIEVVHAAAWQYPSGCPKFNARDRADAEADLEL